MTKKIDKLVVHRPWGYFEQFTHNEKTSVKVHNFKEGGAFSVQYHNHREEFWKVIKGKARARLGDKYIDGEEGAEFFVEKKMVHSIEAVDGEMKLLEICFGDFDEDDEIRLEDKYGRTSPK